MIPYPWPFPKPTPPRAPGDGDFVFDPIPRHLPTSPTLTGEVPEPIDVTVPLEPLPGEAPSAAPAPAAPSEAPATTANWKELLVWLGALAVLWFILTVLAESGNQRLAYALAGLILGGALLFMGPKAIGNARKVFD